jgi:hypothetical protein
MSSSKDEFLAGLQTEVEAELEVAHIDNPEELLQVPQEDWLFSPTDLEREEVGLRNILGAVEALERGPDPGVGGVR